ncbi:PAS domain S-box protein [Halorientalis pallida]|uniref:PAS domain S-box protein n=1 Tax=Halorientalis pallida TaxID=2479928 RepID=A0A498KW12_9EURY|nr:PAS domain S-box protein [Halorientalis pallida]RXK49076.1 PAS domain S-box protein [Halorientalis pallida]
MTERDPILLVAGSARTVPTDLEEQAATSIRRAGDTTAALDALADGETAVLVADSAEQSVETLIERISEAAPEAPVIAVVTERSETDDSLFDAGATGVVTPETVPRLVGPDGPELLARIDREAPTADADRGLSAMPSLEETDLIDRTVDTTQRDGGIVLNHSRDPDQPGRRRYETILQRYETILNTVEDGVYLMDSEGRFVAVNDATEDLTGYQRESLVGRHVSTVLPDADVECGRQLIRELLTDDDRHVGTMEQTIERPDGEEIPCENRLAIVEHDGEFLGNVGVVRDVRARRERERRLREERALVEAIFEAVPDLLYAFDENGEFLRWNDSVPATTGYSDEEIEAMEPLNFLAAEDRQRVADTLRTVVSDRRIEHLEVNLQTRDGERIPHELSGGPVVDEDGDLIGVAGIGRDVSDRAARERKIERQRDELDDLNRINAVIRDIDQALIRAQSRREAEGVVCDRLAASEAYRFATVIGYDSTADAFVPRTGAGDHDRIDVVEAMGTASEDSSREAIRTRSVQVVQNLRASDRLHAWEAAAFECGIRSLAIIPVVFEDTTYGLLSVFATRPDAFDEREQRVLSELGETLGYALATIDREEREQVLTTLQGSTRDLINADSKADVCERVVCATSDVLQTANIGVFLLDGGGDLVRSASTDGFTEQFDADRLRAPGTVDSGPWAAFLDGETTAFEAAELSAVTDEDTRSGLAVPLGGHALLLALSTEPRGFDGDLRYVLELFGTSVEAALDRVEGEATLRARDEELETQNRQLKRQVKINEVIRGVDEALVDGTTRTEIEQSVCERLVSEGSYRFAWIGQFDPATEDLTVRTWAGEGGEYLDTLGSNASEPSYRALDASEPVVVSRVSDQLRDESWRQAALLRSFRSVVAVPLVYENYTYGVLAVYGEESGAFGETERPVFAELGETIANAINGFETKQSLLGDDAIRFKLRLEDETSPLVSLSHHLDCTISLDGVNNWTADGLRAFLTIAGVDSAAVDSALDRAVAVADHRHVGECDSDVYEVEFADQTVLGTLLEHGGLPRELTVAAGAMDLIVDVSHDIHVRELVDAVRATYPTAELIARKDVTRELRSAEQLRSDVLGDLTERQREVLATAHLSGYFERPRESTGQDIADALGVSQPAVNRHLRVAQRTVFDWLLSEHAIESEALDR